MHSIFKSRTIRIRIQNKTLKIKDCQSFHALTGLMFNKMDKIDGALIHSNNVWMPFVKRKLDLLFLDKKFKIIDIQKAVPMTINPETWKIYYSKDAIYCLEIKSGLIKWKENYYKIKLTDNSYARQ